MNLKHVSSLLLAALISIAAARAHAAPQAPVSPVILNESIDDSTLTVTWKKPSTYFRWITISNITGSVASGAYAINISGNPTPHHTNLTFSNVNLTGGSSSKGIAVYQVSNSTFTNVTASTGNFFIEPGSWGNTYTSCVPTPTPH